MNRREFSLAAASAAFAGFALPARAQSDKFPTKPIRVLVPYAPGGATDIAARVVAERMRHILGVAVVVENRPGAFGILAIEEMVRAPADGHVLMVGNPSTNTITPILHAKRMKIDYEKQVTLVGRLVDLPSFLLATTKEFAPKTVNDLVDYAKKNPGKVRYGSAGVGSFPHYTLEVFAKTFGIDLMHVPNKGGGSAYLKDMMTGDIHTGSMNVATAAPVLGNGTVTALAITEAERLKDYPDVPSFAELGIKRPGSGFWHSMFANAATPQPILEALHKAVYDAIQSPDVVQAFDRNRMRRITHTTLAEGQQWLREEMIAWRQITKDVPIDMAE